MASNGQEYKLKILDTAGADEYAHLRDGWIRSNEGFIMVYSISSKVSFARIQRLYNEIQQVKKRRYISSQVPVLLVGNKVDMAEREVSLLEGKEMARKLGCAFVEASAKDDKNVKESFDIIVMQLRTLSIELELLDDLVHSGSEWHDLLNNLEAKANTNALVPVQAMNVATEQLDTKKMSILQFIHVKVSTLQLPGFAKRQRSFPDINTCQAPSTSQSLPVLSQRKANSVDGGISQTSEHPGLSVLEGNYNSQVQKAFEDILKFLSRFGGKIRRIENQAKLTKIMAHGDYSARFGCSEIKDIEGMATVEEVDEMDITQVKKALVKCQKLCEDAAFEAMRREVGDKIQQMKDEFARMIETIAKHR